MHVILTCLMMMELSGLMNLELDCQCQYGGGAFVGKAFNHVAVNVSRKNKRVLELIIDYRFVGD